MANVALSELTELTSLAGGDLLLVTDDSEAGAEQSKYIQVSTLRDYLLITGTYQRPQFTWKDADEIYVGGGFADVAGKWASWTSQLTSDIGSPSASTFYYLYLDYSGITSGTAITASELIWSSTAPAWSHTYRGYYNGSDRCIFGLKTDSSSNIPEFYHSGNNVFFANYVEDRAIAVLSTTWTDVTLSIPGFTISGLVAFVHDSSNEDDTKRAYWRTNGQTASTGHLVSGVREIDDRNQRPVSPAMVLTDSSQIIEVKCDGAGSDVGVYTDGWQFPIGM